MQDVPRVHARQRVEQLLHDGVHCGLRKSAMPLQELLAVAAGHQIEHDGEILRAMVKAPAAYDARMNAHAQELDLVLKVQLNITRSAVPAMSSHNPGLVSAHAYATAKYLQLRPSDVWTPLS